jgi:hypothetical protein
VERSGRRGIPGFAVVASTDRFAGEIGRPPSFIRAGACGAVLHDLKAVLAECMAVVGGVPAAGARQGCRAPPCSWRRRQCTNFLLLHGYYRAAMAELRVALELLIIGIYGNLRPNDSKYVEWKNGGAEFGFTCFRRRMHGVLRPDQGKWVTISPIVQFHPEDEFDAPSSIWRNVAPGIHWLSGSHSLT